MTTTLEPVAAGALDLARQGKGLDAIAKALTEDLPAEAPEAAAPPKLPAPAGRLTMEEVEAIRALPEVFGRVSPAERRVLTDRELAELGAEDIVLRQVADLLADRKKAVAEIVRGHADAAAEAAGLAPAVRAADGHYLLSPRPGMPFQIRIPGTPRSWSLEFRTGSVRYDSAALRDLRDEGGITRAEFDGMTERVFSPARAAEYIRRHPARGLEILKGITRKGAAGNSLFLRRSRD